MFFQLAHTKTPVFQESKKFTLECYRITKDFPGNERFAMVQQIRRAALSVHLNIAEGCSLLADEIGESEDQAGAARVGAEIRSAGDS